MSDFSIRADQRARLLQGDYRPLVYRTVEFPLDLRERLPAGCKVGARYVLARERGWGLSDDGRVRHLPPAAVWFITVTKVLGGPQGRRERPDGSWLVQFDVTDNRDRAAFLRPGGGELLDRDPLEAGAKPDPDWLDSEAEAIGEFWELERLKRNAVELRRQHRSRRQRAA